MYFVANVHGKEVINSKAASIGCVAGEVGYGWEAKPGLIGKTFGIKEQLKAEGARWNSASKSWYFEDWESLEAAIDSINS